MPGIANRYGSIAAAVTTLVPAENLVVLVLKGLIAFPSYPRRAFLEDPAGQIAAVASSRFRRSHSVCCMCSSSCRMNDAKWPTST